jgi:hypothetical protein
LKGDESVTREVNTVCFEVPPLLQALQASFRVVICGEKSLAENQLELGAGNHLPAAVSACQLITSHQSLVTSAHLPLLMTVKGVVNRLSVA